MNLMHIKDVNIKLDFFSDSPIHMSDGSILSTPADIDGRWNSASGTYQQKEKETISQLYNDNNKLQQKNEQLISIMNNTKNENKSEIHKLVEENKKYIKDNSVLVHEN